MGNGNCQHSRKILHFNLFHFFSVRAEILTKSTPAESVMETGLVFYFWGQLWLMRTSTHHLGWNWQNTCCLNHKGTWRYLEDEHVWQMTKIYLSASCISVCAISSLTEMQSEFTFTQRDGALTHAYQSLIQWNNNKTWRYATVVRITLLHTYSQIYMNILINTQCLSQQLLGASFSLKNNL